jgi:hypothetical protein
MPDPQYVGSFIPLTQTWDVSEIYTTDVSSPAFKELLVRMYQNINNMAMVINTKDTGIYPTSEFVNSQVWFPNPAYDSSTPQTATQRQVFRKVINFGALPNAGTRNVAHGLTFDANTTLTRLYGAASNPAALAYIPLPFATPTALNANISLSLGLVGPIPSVIVTTGIDYSAYTVCYVVIEFIRN